MPPHHEPFKALSPIDWDTIPSDSLGDFISDTFAEAQTIIDSIPAPAPVQAAASGSSRRARSQTDPPLPSATINHSLSARQSAAAMGHAQDLMKEWKEVKLNARDNPLAINVYKLAAKDGKGAWFSRRSVHDGMTFDKWKLGLEREFAESMKVQTGPGGGSIRGIGADKRVEHHVVDGVGKAEVFQLSAQFPGPTAPRDFITLLLSSDASKPSPRKGEQRPLRSFMILSKPCVHEECPPRQGIIRGQYESVEIIREVPSDKPVMRRARSSVDIGSDEAQKRQSIAEGLGKEAVLRAAQQVAADGAHQRDRGVSVDSAPARDPSGANAAGADELEEEEEIPTTIEWLMVTRSDPGGNVPRFMIERGTPGGIVSDAGKFLKWLTAKSVQDFESDANPSQDAEDPAKASAAKAEETKARSKSLAPAPTANLVPDDDKAGDPDGGLHNAKQPEEQVPSSNGLYGIISGAFGFASSAVSGKIPTNLPGFFYSATNSSAESVLEDRLDDSDSDSSSIRSFTSAVEGNDVDGAADSKDDTQPAAQMNGASPPVADDAASNLSAESSLRQAPGGASTSTTTRHERDIKKLSERRQRAIDKMQQLQARMASKKSEDSAKDAAALGKLREKHDRDLAKQEEKYQRELQRLERKREQDLRKAEDKRRKQAERQEKANLSVELEKTRVDRDLALKQVEMLKLQVGELQAQNTTLVREMGKLSRAAGGGGQNGGAAGGPGTLSRAGSTLSAGSANGSLDGSAKRSPESSSSKVAATVSP